MSVYQGKKLGAKTDNLAIKTKFDLKSDKYIYNLISSSIHDIWMILINYGYKYHKKIFSNIRPENPFCTKFMTDKCM